METASLFRALSVTELKELLTTGQFAFRAGGMEAKQFGLKLDEVITYAGTSREYAAIVQVTVPKEVLGRLGFSSTIDPFIFRSGVVTAEGAGQLRLLNESVISIQRVR